MSSSDLVRGITVENLRDYLRETGWHQQTNYPRRDVLVFTGPRDDNGEPIDCVFPAAASAPNFASDVARVIAGLAIIEHREPSSLADDVRSSYVDRLTVRLSSESTHDGSLPMARAVQMMSGLRSLLVSGARMETNPAPAHIAPRQRDTDFGDSCRLGQTELGSFIINVHVPLLPDNSRNDLLPRRVLNRIIRGLHLVTEVRKPEQLVERYESGMNANMLEAMADLRPDTDKFDLDIASRFSWRARASRDQLDAVHLAPTHFDIMEEGARQLRALSLQPERPYRGRIRTLVSNTGQVNIDITEGAERYQLHAYLEPADYRKAVHAHDSNLDVIVVGRRCLHGPQRWIDDVVRFDIAPEKQ